MSVTLDLRDERGRFFARPVITDEAYAILELLAKTEGITFEEVIHRAIQEQLDRTEEERNAQPAEATADPGQDSSQGGTTAR